MSTSRGKFRGSPKSIRFILWEPWIAVQNFIASIQWLLRYLQIWVWTTEMDLQNNIAIHGAMLQVKPKQTKTWTWKSVVLHRYFNRAKIILSMTSCLVTLFGSSSEIMFFHYSITFWLHTGISSLLLALQDFLDISLTLIFLVHLSHKYVSMYQNQQHVWN